MSVARGGRLPSGVDAAMRELNASVDVDQKLWREDIQGSIAHARGLKRAGVIDDDDLNRLTAGLEQISGEIERGEFVWDPDKEDVHMNIEARLIELHPEAGAKLHTGRSRNDQVATDFRLWCRARTQETLDAIRELAEVLLDCSLEQIEVLMPTYTHLQRAQPSRLSHHLMAWQEMLWRDHGRLTDALTRLNESPLGAGAVAGSGFPLDRDGVAGELGFDRPMRNSIDATASRDFAMELASALAIVGVHLSRIGEEIVIWSSTEFGFVTLSDGFSTSSSMMPQKKNPDVAELIRGKSAGLVGAAVSLMVLEKSLCFGYGRDLQEDKAPLFEAFRSVVVCLKALSGALATATFNRAALEGALEEGHVCATDLADYLVLQGVPFRQAHHMVGALVREAEQRGVQLRGLDRATLASHHESLARDEVAQVLDPKSAVERRALVGGPGKARVEEAVRDARKRWQLD